MCMCLLFLSLVTHNDSLKTVCQYIQSVHTHIYVYLLCCSISLLHCYCFCCYYYYLRVYMCTLYHRAKERKARIHIDRRCCRRCRRHLHLFTHIQRSSSACVCVCVFHFCKRLCRPIVRCMPNTFLIDTHFIRMIHDFKT